MRKDLPNFCFCISSIPLYLIASQPILIGLGAAAPIIKCFINKYQIICQLSLKDLLNLNNVQTVYLIIDLVDYTKTEHFYLFFGFHINLESEPKYKKTYTYLSDNSVS